MWYAHRVRITLESTSQLIELAASDPLKGLTARVWEGQTESGIKVVAFVAMIAVDEKDQAAFDEQLQTRRPPIVQWPQRFLV